jgi:hypothetical protein
LVAASRPAGILIGYQRCSTEKQDLTAQRRILSELGVEDERVYPDHGLTGRNRSRPSVTQALTALGDGDTLVVPKLDRLARSVPDARAIGDSLAARGVRLSLGGNVYDPTDPMGKMFFNILATFAEFEVDLLRMRTREGIAIEDHMPASTPGGVTPPRLSLRADRGCRIETAWGATNRQFPWRIGSPSGGPATAARLGRRARKYRDRLDGDEQAARETYVGRGRPCRRRIGHVPGVDLVETAEVFDVCVEDRCFDHVLQGRPSGAEHGGEVQQRLLGLRFDPVRDFAGRGVDACHPRAEDQAARDDRLAVGPERFGGLFA